MIEGVHLLYGGGVTQDDDTGLEERGGIYAASFSHADSTQNTSVRHNGATDGDVGYFKTKHCHSVVVKQSP